MFPATFSGEKVSCLFPATFSVLAKKLAQVNLMEIFLCLK
jgi:hypothetical protein